MRRRLLLAATSGFVALAFGAGVPPAAVRSTTSAVKRIDGQRGADLQHDARLHVGAESLQGDFEPIRTERQVRRDPPLSRR
jgi:hypothetical protein